jgi:hypothetical protein
MKLTFTRASALLALALGLSGCGGKATFELGGPVTGLAYTGLEITNITNGDKKIVATTDTSFKLGQTLEYGQVYDVQITAQPANQTCVLSGGADTAGRLSSISIPVTCVVQTFTIGGKVTGLVDVAGTTPSGLVVTNGTDKLAIEINGAYVMPTRVPYDQPYGVTIVTQPTGKTCTVSNPSGVVKTVTNSLGTTNPVDNINIDCV